MSRFRPLVILVVMTLSLLAVPVRDVVAQDATPEATAAPRFTNTVQVDGRRIGLTCEGSGSPTVVLIAGTISPGEKVWPGTVDALSPLTRVCVFDRAGQGASDPAPTVPQSAADVVADLGAALEAAGESGPFVPVGWSFGGLVAQLFASTYPDHLAGLVLVEGVPAGRNIVDLTLTPWTAAEQAGLRELVTGREPENLASPTEEFVSEAQVLAAPLPPPMPTIMIVANKIDWLVSFEDPVTWRALESAAWFHLFQAAQARDLGARIVLAPESSHLVMFEQPEVAIAAIEDVVNAVRDPSSWATPVADAG